MWPKKVVMAAQQLQMICQSFDVPSMAERAPMQVRGTLPNRQIQSLNVRCVQFLGILGRSPEFFPTPGGTRSRLSIHFENAVIAPFLDHLTKQARRTKDAFHNLSIELEAVRSDQRDSRAFHPGTNVLEQSHRVSVTAIPDLGAWPKPGPHFDGRKDPNLRCFTAFAYGANLIGLQFSSNNVPDLEMVESTTNRRSFLKPTIHGVPAKALDSCNRGLAHTLDAQRSHRIKRRAPVVQTIVNRATSRAESPATATAKKSATPAKTSPVEAVPDLQV